jgi:hypothetical protein
VTAGADDRPAAAIGRVRVMVAALTDPVPALLHAVAAAERLASDGPALPVVDVDPFAAVPGAAGVVPEGRTPGRARRGGRVTTRRPADPRTRPMATTPGASRPVEPVAAATEERHDVTAPSADAGRQTASRTAGDPTSVGDAERTFAVLATRRVDAVLAREAGDATPRMRQRRAVADAAGLGVDERRPAGAGGGSATSTERDPEGGRPGTAAAAFGAPATGDAAVTAATGEHAPPPPPAGPRPDAAPAGTDVEPAPPSRSLGDGPAVHANGFTLRRGGAPAARGASAASRAAAGSASVGGPVHIPEVTVAARPGVAAPGPSGPPALPLDPEDLAALVNEVLAEQARRHGVDLS